MAIDAALRPLARVPLPEGTIPSAPPTAPPQILWVRPAQLVVNTRYQRDLSDKSAALIRRIATGFDWRKYKPPIVSQVATTEDGEPMYEVVDGQHTASGVSTHGGIELLPVLLIEAGEAAAAAAFVSHNRDRIAMMNSQLLHAQAQAGDEDALTVQLVCQRAGITLLRVPPQRGIYKPRQCIATGALLSLVKKRSAQQARIVLEVAASTDAAPVVANLIKAVDLVLNGEDYSGEVTPDDLKVTLLRLAAHEKSASVHAIAHRLPLWKTLGLELYRQSRKTRRAA